MTLPDIDIVVGAATLLCALYVAGACLCRVKDQHPLTTTQHGWALLYVSVFGIALWSIYDVLHGASTGKDTLIMLALALYIFKTRRAWAQGVPAIVTKKTG